MHCADNRIGPSIVSLNRVLGSITGVSKALKHSGWLLEHNLEKGMIPKIEFLRSCGICSSHIVNFIPNFPRFFLHKPETMKGLVKRVDEIGFDRESKMYLYAIRVISSMSVKTWELKWDLFCGLGLSNHGLAMAFQKTPLVFTLSERKIKEAMKVFLDIGKCDISWIATYPHVLCHSVKRSKQRLLVLGVLESKNLLLKMPSLTTVCGITDKKFFERFVLPYKDEVGEIYASSKV